MDEWSIHLSYVHGTQISWMDQQIINEGKWDTHSTTCYDPKLFHQL